MVEVNSGTANTGSGYNTLVDNTTGTHNTASGAFALEFNLTGSNHTAIGSGALDGRLERGERVDRAVVVDPPDSGHVPEHVASGADGRHLTPVVDEPHRQPGRQGPPKRGREQDVRLHCAVH